MLTKSLTLLIIAALIGGPVSAAQEFPYAREKIGKLHLGLSATAVKQIIPGRPISGPEELMGADGQYHQEWAYPDAGITLGMVSGKKGGLKSLASITIAGPSKLRTQRGIGIGSTAAEVAKAYDLFRNAEVSTPECFVAGSDFGGGLFYLQQGRVSSIFIGAAAE
jgi:hypothetical protein